MTREQEIKNNLCEYINNLTTKELFNITSHFEDILNPKIPDAATLRCEKCKQIYGECKDENHESHVMNECMRRFIDYCKTETEC